MSDELAGKIGFEQVFGSEDTFNRHVCVHFKYRATTRVTPTDDIPLVLKLNQ